MNLNQLTLPALDIAESARFYRAMGFVQIVDSPHYERFECPQGDSTFSLHRVDAVATDSSITVSSRIRTWMLGSNGFERRPSMSSNRPRINPTFGVRRGCATPPATCCACRAGKNRKYPPWRVELT